MDIYEKLKAELKKIILQNQWGNEEVEIITTRKLSPEEAIGKPERNDFPLLKGKEVMIEADYKGAKGQAYTDYPGNFKGSLSQVINLKLENNFERAVFIATLNAVLKHLGLIEGTRHCKDQEPALCAEEVVKYISKRFGKPKIAFIGFQPALIESLARHFLLRVTDLDADNIGKFKCGVLIEDPFYTKDIISWGDIVLATGSTAVNATINEFIGEKPVVFYGVTVAGIAKIFGYDRFCYCAH